MKTPKAIRISRPKSNKGSECDHAWILNVKPAVCLWCGALKEVRQRGIHKPKAFAVRS